MKQRSRLAEYLVRALAALLAVAIFVALLAFSIVLFALAATAAVLLFGYVWWTTRRLRAEARARSKAAGRAPGGGEGAGKEIVEVEVIRVTERTERE
jgi:ABC-type bacteriocin/lantibiotic exporter with double-glycine peptidase domain